MNRALASLTCAIALCGGPAMGQDADRIGVAAVAKNSVTGTLGSVQRRLAAGDPVSQNQQIRTGSESSAQLLFRDETTLTLGAESVVVLDKAVYDPRKGAGEITVRAVSGAFRFVSGASPSTNYKITTPAGTIGVRGTIVDGEIIGQIFVAIVRQGSAEYCPSPGNCLIVNAGQFIVLSGGAFTAPKPINDHACGMTGLGGGQSRCAAKLIGSILALGPGQINNLGADFQPGNFTGGPPPGAGPGSGPGGSCAVFLPNGNCYPGVGAPGQGGVPPGLKKK